MLKKHVLLWSSIRVAARYLEKKASDSDLINKAKKFFGTTRNPKEAGYLLPDGTMLDFSGRSQMPESYDQVGTQWKIKPGKKDWRFSQRDQDHREIIRILDKKFQSPTQAMFYFMRKTGAIRMTSYGVTVVTVPTVRQAQILTGIWRQYHRGEIFTIDISDPNSGYTKKEIDLPAWFNYTDIIEKVQGK